MFPNRQRAMADVFSNEIMSKGSPHSNHLVLIKDEWMRQYSNYIVLRPSLTVNTNTSCNATHQCVSNILTVLRTPSLRK